MRTGSPASVVLTRVEIQNPPYGRVRLSGEERERWAHVLYGHANLYGLFVAAAEEDLDGEGVLAALVPTSFTSGLYFSRLRETLAKRTPLRSTTFVAARDGVFANVLQETCLAVFTRRRTQSTAISTINGHVQSVARVKAPRTGLPWLLPRRPDDAPTAAAAARMPLRLADLGYRCQPARSCGTDAAQTSPPVPRRLEFRSCGLRISTVVGFTATRHATRSDT